MGSIVRGVVVVLLVAVAVLVAAGANAGEPYTVRVSVKSDGAQGNGGSYLPVMTPDARYVAFASDARLVSGTTPYRVHVYVHDRDYDEDGILDEQYSGAIKTTLISVAPDGSEGDAPSGWSDQLIFFRSIDISDDGRFIAFASQADNLVEFPPGFVYYDEVIHVFLHDRDADEDGVYDEAGETSTELVDQNGFASADSDAFKISVSGDGEWVTFESFPGNVLFSGGCYLLERETGEMGCITWTPEPCGDGFGYDPEVSTDGSYVVFLSKSCCLTSPPLCDPYYPPPDGTQISPSAFRYERSGGARVLATVHQSGEPFDGEEGVLCYDPKVSGDGRYVVFTSTADDIVPYDTNWATDVFLRDLASSLSERVSVATGGTEANGESGGDGQVALSPTGRYVAFYSGATNLGSPPGSPGVYVRDRLTDETWRSDLTDEGQVPVGYGPGLDPSLSRNARYVAFDSDDPNLIGPGQDTNGSTDVFVRYRGCEGLLPCDANCDGTVNAGDIPVFVLALTNPAGYAQQYPDCDLICNNDANGDGLLNADDIPAFIECLTG